MAHAHAHPVTDAGRAPLRTALALTACIAVLECAGGFAAHSLALVADSAHVLMDAIALGIAVVASIGAQRPANERQSYGFARFEILAALANGGLLFAIAVLIAAAAVSRFAAPQLPQGRLMALVAGVGFLTNVGIGWSLLAGSRRDLNVRAAFLHVASDAMGAVAVAAGGLLILATGASWIDPAVSLAIAGLVAFGVVGIVREATGVLLQSAPAHASIARVRERMRAVPGVVDVHDLHVWTIGSGSFVLSAHVLLPDARISEASAILRHLERCLLEDFAIGHVTIQFECESCDADGRIICTQAGPRRGALSADPEREHHEI
jgi:cobalt-zinc-cadmium efflux system protein